jgi:hypothetical protein
MNAANRIGLIVVLAAVPRGALAEHDHGGGHHDMDGTTEVESSFGAGAQLVAARFATTTFVGDYQGVVPQLQWTRGRFGATASLGLYRLTENGRLLHGIGDTMLAGQGRLIGRRTAQLGLAAGMSLPTGDHVVGLGMGHVMVMPAAWGTWMLGTLMFEGSFGYGRAIGGDAHHDHGSWPLVDPMNMQEITWSAAGSIALGNAIRAGIRTSGGVPIGMGINRVVAGVRAVWVEGRVETAAELQTGVSGDPFTIRGLVESAVHF